MERSTAGRYFGSFGIALLLVSYIRMLNVKILTLTWTNTIVALSTAALIVFIIAARLSRRRWYWGALFAVLSLALLFLEVNAYSLLTR